VEKVWGLLDPSRHYNEWEKALEKIEPAWAKAALALRGETRFGHGDLRAMSLVAVHETLEVHRRHFETGDTLALLVAVKSCAAENVPLPTWLALAYMKALDSFLKVGGAPYLDDVFQSPHLPTETPKRAAKARQDWTLGGEIMAAVWDEARADESLQSLDETLDRVLKKRRFGVGKTKARELFNMVEKRQIEGLKAMGSSTQPISRLFAKRRKNGTR